MSTKGTQTKTVTVTIDGIEIEAEEGRLLISAALDNGLYIPHFCWHPRLEPVAMCRLCLVEVEGVRGLPPACTTRITDGMVVKTKSAAAASAQQAVLELLLINHPLDCPVCDKGGECPLQDQTLAFGPGESRYVEEKRHFEKPIPISPLVLLDRERCILCARCTRFAGEIAGDPLISFVGRGNGTQVLTFHDDPFASYFSGNTVEICPVGALTAVPYRFSARPWDLEQTDSTCLQCAVGCRVAMQSTTGKLVRFLGIDSDAVNQGWLCDKGRFSFEHNNSTERLTAPRIRSGPRANEVTWAEALDRCAERLEAIVERWGPSSVAFLGGARGSNEGAYCYARLARAVIGTPNLDAQMGDGLDPAFLLSSGAGERALLSDLDTASCIVFAGPDPKEELPVLYLRIRRAAVSFGVPLIEVGGRETSLTRYAHTVVRTREGEPAYTLWALARAVGSAEYFCPDGVEKSALDQAIEVLKYPTRPGRPVIVAGRDNLAAHPAGLESAALELAAATSAKILPVEHRSNVFGAVWSGLSPALLPGGRGVDDPDARSRCEELWGRSSTLDAGLGAAGILESAADGEIRALVLMGADPIGDFPDSQVARRALEAAELVVAVDVLPSRSAEKAHVLFPAAAHGEYSGSSMNFEGRLFWNNQKVRPYGRSRPDWYVAIELAERLGDRSFPEGTSEIFGELAKCAAIDGDVTAGKLATASTSGEGIVVADTFAPYSRRLEVPEPPRPGQYSFRLVSTRRLYGNGSVDRACPHLSGLAEAPRALLAPRDMDRLGLSGGEPVRLVGERAACVLPAWRDPYVTEGSVAVTFNVDLPDGSVTVAGESLGSAQISALIDHAERMTEVRLETVDSGGSG